MIRDGTLPVDKRLSRIIAFDDLNDAMDRLDAAATVRKVLVPQQITQGPAAVTSFKFSANTGFLWKERPFLDRIRQAAIYGFEGVEFHDEAQITDRAALKDVLAETGLPVFSLNVHMGETFGCAALPEAGNQAKRDVDHAVEVAQDIGAGAIHILAGLVSGPDAHQAYLQTLRHALANSEKTILIEPVSSEQVPGYFLRTIEQAADILSEVDSPRLKILFDCYHIHRESGDVSGRFTSHADKIGHVQIAAAEKRAEPFPGALDYCALLPEFQTRGYSGPFGCEYRPTGKTETGLAWRKLI